MKMTQWRQLFWIPTVISYNYSCKKLGFLGPFIKLRRWDVTLLCMQEEQSNSGQDILQ